MIRNYKRPNSRYNTASIITMLHIDRLRHSNTHVLKINVADNDCHDYRCL